MSNNIFNQYYAPLRYPGNWITNIKTFFRSCKWAWQRITKGYSSYDVWNFDLYLSNVISGGAFELGQTTHTYPDGITYEEWQDILFKIGRKFYSSIEDNDVYHNPYEETYYNQYKDTTDFIDTINARERTDLDDKFFEVEHKNAIKRQEDLHEGLALLTEYYSHLWD